MQAPSFARRLPAQRFSELVAPAMQKAKECTDCGKCEERCPYHLEIRKMISEQVEWYEAEKRKYQERNGCAS